MYSLISLNYVITASLSLCVNVIAMFVMFYYYIMLQTVSNISNFTTGLYFKPQCTCHRHTVAHSDMTPIYSRVLCVSV